MNEPKPILKPIHIPMKLFTYNIDDQHFIMMVNPQCPKHLHMLNALRCDEHDYCAKTEACNACIKENNEQTRSIQYPL